MGRQTDRQQRQRTCTQTSAGRSVNESSREALKITLTTTGDRTLAPLTLSAAPALCVCGAASLSSICSLSLCVRSPVRMKSCLHTHNCVCCASPSIHPSTRKGHPRTRTQRAVCTVHPSTSLHCTACVCLPSSHRSVLPLCASKKSRERWRDSMSAVHFMDGCGCERYESKATDGTRPPLSLYHTDGQQRGRQ